VSLRETENNLSLSIASLDHDNNHDHDHGELGLNPPLPQDDGNGVGGGDLLRVRAMLSQAEQRCERMREAMRQLVRQSNHGGASSSSSKRVQPSTTVTTSHSQPPPLHPQSTAQSQSSSWQHQTNRELLQLQSRWEEIHAQIHAAHAAAKASSSAAAQNTNTPVDDNTRTNASISAADAASASLIPLASLFPAASPLSLHPHLVALLHGPSSVAVNIPANHLLTVRRTLDRLTALGALPPAPLPEPSAEGVVSSSESLFALGDPRHQLLHALLVDPNHRLPPARRSQNFLSVVITTTTTNHH